MAWGKATISLEPQIMHLQLQNWGYLKNTVQYSYSTVVVWWEMIWRTCLPHAITCTDSLLVDTRLRLVDVAWLETASRPRPAISRLRKTWGRYGLLVGFNTICFIMMESGRNDNVYTILLLLYFRTVPVMCENFTPDPCHIFGMGVWQTVPPPAGVPFPPHLCRWL